MEELSGGGGEGQAARQLLTHVLTCGDSDQNCTKTSVVKEGRYRKKRQLNSPLVYTESKACRTLNEDKERKEIS